MIMKIISTIKSHDWSCASRDKNQLNKRYTFVSKFQFAALSMHVNMIWDWTANRFSDIFCINRLELIESLQSSSARMTFRVWWFSTLREHWLRVSACNENLEKRNCQISTWSINKELISHCDRSSCSSVDLMFRYESHINRNFDLLLEELNVKSIFDRESKLTNWVLEYRPRLNRHRSLLVSLTALIMIQRLHESRDVTSRSRSSLTLRIVKDAVESISYMSLISRI